ncbi:hypothetical protein GOV08_01800 [Candidatus Woesearchaeota archaeon]|nr:hypothetical protein [Candidatus Woesearchaeota archaeon]
MTIVDGEKIVFKGLFDMRELYNIIDAYLWQKGFDKRVMKNEEHVQQDGKFIHVIMQPWKKISYYVKHEIKIDLSVHHAKEETREIDGVKRKFTNGTFEAKFWGYLVTDYEGRWEQRPEYFFLRTIFDKFVYKLQNANFASLLKNDVRLMKAEIESFLNLHRFT